MAYRLVSFFPVRFYKVWASGGCQERSCKEILANVREKEPHGLTADRVVHLDILALNLQVLLLINSSLLEKSQGSL